MEINSNEWWEEYFLKNNWSQNKGNEQSQFFTNILLNNLSKEIKQEISDNQYNICDIGCAEGDGTNILKEKFPSNEICGIDVSATAIKTATIKFPNITFRIEDINTAFLNYDIIICSNVLEYFREPKDILNKLLSFYNKYLIIMVPFKEKSLEFSHFYTFTEDDFIPLLGEYEIVEKRIISTKNFQPTFWNGEQLLIVIKHSKKFLIEKESRDIPNKQTWDKVSKSYDVCISDSEKNLAHDILKIISSMGIKKNSSIIELGCGSGHLSACLAKEGYKVTLLDFSKVALKKARQTFEKYNLTGTFIEGDILDLSKLSEKYDLIWNSGVMEHFDDENLLKTFSSIKQLMSSNNSPFLFLVPNPNSIAYLLMRYNLYSQKKWNYGYEYLRKNYLELAKQSGLNGKIEGYVSGSMSNWHFESTFMSDPNRTIYSNMMDNNLLPENEKYLIVYSVYIDKENINLDKEKENLLCDSNISIEEYFKVNAELFGKTKENMILNQKLEVKIEEINRLNNVVDVLTKTILEKNNLLKIKENMLENIENKLLCVEGENKELQVLNIKVNEELEQKKNTLLLIKNKCMIMGNSHLFKLVHLLYRSKYQGYNSDKNERKKYRNWLRSKILFKTGDNDRRYNPIYQIINLIDNNSYYSEKKLVLENKVENSEKKKKRELINILKDEIANKRVIVFPYTIDYHMPLFQRPQQLVKSYSKKEDIVAIYLTINAQYDHVKYAENIQKNLWLIEKNFFEKHIDILENAKEKILSISLTTNKHYIDMIKPNKLIYEYIDELEIFYGYGPEMEKDHKRLIKEADVTVCTATKLYEQVKQMAKNPIISTNAGDYEFFKKTEQFDINPLVKEKIKGYDCILGYYGSLAEWVDYKIIYDVAIKNPKWLWILVGVDYDGSLQKSGILELENILYVSPQPYEMLPTFLKAFTIATIPFKINEITLSTSPVKLFEYMAAGKPILSSKLPECLKYKSVITYENSDNFIKKVYDILSLSSEDLYWDKLKEEALNNTWEAKVDEILKEL